MFSKTFTKNTKSSPLHPKTYTFFTLIKNVIYTKIFTKMLHMNLSINYTKYEETFNNNFFHKNLDQKITNKFLFHNLDTIYLWLQPKQIHIFPQLTKIFKHGLYNWMHKRKFNYLGTFNYEYVKGLRIISPRHL